MKYNKGDIIVHIKPEDDRQRGAGFIEGEMWEFEREEQGGLTLWKKSGYGIYYYEARLAKAEEIRWFKQGNTNIQGMPKTLSYEIY